MNIARIFPFRSARIQRAQALASQAEAYVRMLSHLPPEYPEEASQDIITILESTCGMLERLVEYQDAFSGKPDPDQTHSTFAAQQPSPAMSSAYQALPSTDEIPDEAPSDVDAASDTDMLDASSVTGTSAPEILAEPPKRLYVEPDPEPSEVAKDLIRLRDWVLLAKSGGTAVEPAVLEEISRQLARVLAKEGITPLEEGGPYDYNRQSVAGVQPTDDPAQDDQVYSTVKPGYLFQGKLVRPQEVIVYTYQHTQT